MKMLFPTHLHPRPSALRRIGWIPVLALVLIVAGCDDDDTVVEIVDDPPAIPNGVYSITGDQTVFLRWNPNREDDLAGYRIWVNEDLSETFDELVDVGAFEDGVYFDNDTPNDVSDDFLEFEDGPLVNGRYYSYAVSAYDQAGNESDLSFELVIDLPRPEGGAGIFFRDVSSAQAGFDFSDGTNTSIGFDAAATDVFIERVDGVPFLVVPNDRVRIQDYGFVGFDVLTFAPLNGYSATGRVEAIEGHTYAFRIASAPGDFDEQEDNYAKLEILSIDGTGMDFFWGYQPVDGDRELRPADDGGRDGDDRIPNDGLPEARPNAGGTR